MKPGLKCFIWILLIFSSCYSTRPSKPFDQYPITSQVDYSLEKNWAALPWRADAADSLPEGLKDIQLQSQADVFFVHPTSYLAECGNDRWNADILNHKINELTDASAIVYQASLFNGVGKIYAPRYRQAHYKSFFSKDTASARKALQLAYTDVRDAFTYYMQHYNNGRPIILAGHSQGAAHLIRLMKEFFDNEKMKKRLVVAYAVGFAIPLDAFQLLKPCASKFETECICSWRSFKTGYEGKYVNSDKPVIVTNPLNWSIHPDVYIDKSMNLGSVLDDISVAPSPGLCGAQIHKSILWVDKPKFKGSFLYWASSFHRGDFNLFYMNVRENAINRLGAYWKN